MDINIDNYIYASLYLRALPHVFCFASTLPVWYRPCKLVNGEQVGFCPTLSGIYGGASECNCQDSEWPKLKTPVGGVQNVDYFESECHDHQAWRRCAQVESQRQAKDPAAAKTSKHHCEFCDNQELCSITESLVTFSGPHFTGKPLTVHPRAIALLSRVDDAAKTCGVAIDVHAAYDPGWMGEAMAENGRSVKFSLVMSEPVEAAGEQEEKAGNIVANQAMVTKMSEGSCNGGLVYGDICKRFPQGKCFVDAVKAFPGLKFVRGLLQIPAAGETAEQTAEHAKLAELAHEFSCAKTVFKVGELGSTFVEVNRVADTAGLNEACVAAAQTAAFYNDIGVDPKSFEVFNTGVEGRIVNETPERECEYANQFAGTSEPFAPLVDACNNPLCCGRPPSIGPAGCADGEGMPHELLSRHFKAHQFMSRQKSKVDVNTVVFNDGSKVEKRNRFFRADSTLLTCLDLVADKAANDLFKDDPEGKVRKLSIVEGYWTMSQAMANGVENAGSRHRAGTAVRFAYELGAGEKLEQSRLITLAGFIVSECEQYMATTGLSMGVGLQSDSVYMDVQKRGDKLFMPFSGDGAALASEDFARWIDKGRYVFNEECVRPPQVAQRQSAGYEYTYRREERRRERRQLGDLFAFVMGSDPYCKGTLAAREKEFEAMWQRISTTIGARAGNRKSDDEIKGALTRCYMSCSGGLVDKVNKDSEEKHRACSEAIHWLPVLFSAGDEAVDSCHFYPQKSEDLQRSACFWGKCIDTSDVHASIWPSWGLQLDRKIDDTFFKKNLTVRETLFDEVMNPSPMHQVLQETYAMHCGGKATIWVSHPGEITGMRDTLRALMGYNTKISHVELQITSVEEKFDIIDAVENLRDDWQVSLCRSHSREFLAPFVVVTEGDVLAGKNVGGDEDPSNPDACSVNKDCGSCTAHADNRDLAKKCNWCPLTESCHDYLSTPGSCAKHEVYTENKYCECKAGFESRTSFAKASSGSPNAVCSWLTAKTAGTLSGDTTVWKGGDFLAPAYTKAATCVCTGAGNDLWDSDVASCVRNEFVKGHKEIEPALKISTRAKPADYDPARWPTVIVPPEIINTLYDIQVKAYATCGCPGGVADFVTWTTSFYSNVAGGKFGGCAATNENHLRLNRCGCGF